MKTGLFYGSFNPVHAGHLIIANYVVEYTDIQQLWFIVSPHNPLKKRENLLNDYDRMEMVSMAIDKDPRFWACDIEFNLPKPSYTIDTLSYLKEKYPGREFVLIMGSDGLETFHKWKNYQQIVDNYKRYVYPRPGHHPENMVNKENIKNIKMINAPLIEISSTFIRQAIKNHKDVKYFLPWNVYKYILDMHFYE